MQLFELMDCGLEKQRRRRTGDKNMGRNFSNIPTIATLENLQREYDRSDLVGSGSGDATNEAANVGYISYCGDNLGASVLHSNASYLKPTPVEATSISSWSGLSRFNSY